MSAASAVTLRMPEHVVPEPHEDALDRYSAVKGILCRAGFEPGYAHMNPDGTLHCNRCGWVTPEPVVTSYSPDTDCTYLTWDELVAAEANGYVVVGTIDRKNTVPVVVGPYDTKAEAEKARVRLRRKWKREAREQVEPGKISTFIRPAWKETRRG